jgi:tetratricopeptide (TPR) repeat protein
MRRTLLALFSAALLLILPAIGNAQQGGAPSPAKPAQRGAQTPAPPSLIPLDGRYLAARVAEQDHDYDAAADQIDLALAQTPDDPELLYSAFRLRIYAGRIDAAVQLAPQVLATRPGDGFANLVLAVQAIKKGDYRAAEQQIDKIGPENQLGPLREYVLAWLKAGEKEFPAARAQLAKLQPATGERAEAPALVIQAQIDEMAGDKAAAEAKYRRAISLDPSGLRTTVAVAEGLRRLGKADDARQLLKTYGEKYSDAVVMDGLIGPNAPAPKPPTAASGVAEILFDIGGILASDQRNPRADLGLIFYQLAASLRPEHDFAWLMISGLYEQFQLIPKARSGRARRSTGRRDCGSPPSTPSRRSSTRPSASCARWSPRSPTASTRHSRWPTCCAARSATPRPCRPTTRRSSACATSRSATGRYSLAAASSRSASSNGPRPRPT